MSTNNMISGEYGAVTINHAGQSMAFYAAPGETVTARAEAERPEWPCDLEVRDFVLEYGKSEEFAAKHIDAVMARVLAGPPVGWEDEAVLAVVEAEREDRLPSWTEVWQFLEKEGHSTKAGEFVRDRIDVDAEDWRPSARVAAVKASQALNVIAPKLVAYLGPGGTLLSLFEREVCGVRVMVTADTGMDLGHQLDIELDCINHSFTVTDPAELIRALEDAAAVVEFVESAGEVEHVV